LLPKTSREGYPRPYIQLSVRPHRVLVVRSTPAAVVKPLPASEGIRAGGTLFQAFRTNPLRWATHHSGRHGLSLTILGEHSSLARYRLAGERREHVKSSWQSCGRILFETTNQNGFETAADNSTSRAVKLQRMSFETSPYSGIMTVHPQECLGYRICGDMAGACCYRDRSTGGGGGLSRE